VAKNKGETVKQLDFNQLVITKDGELPDKCVTHDGKEVICLVDFANGKVTSVNGYNVNFIK
jgi:hypothetical protein